MALIQVTSRPALGGLAPRLRAGLPLPAASFVAGSISAQGWYDPALRGQRPNTALAALLPGRTPYGQGVQPPYDNTTRYFNTGLPSLDLDTAGTSVTTAYSFWWATSGTHTGATFRLACFGSTSGQRVWVNLGANGLQLNHPGGTESAFCTQADGVGKLHTIVASVKDTETLLYWNGRLVHQISHGAVAWTATANYFGLYGLAGSGTEQIAQALQGACWFGQHDADWLERVSRGPAELWEPQRIWVPVSSGSPPAPPVGRADEADTAFGLTGNLTGAAGQTLETDSALGLTGSLSAPVGLAAEADTALGLGGSLQGAVGLAQEVDEAFGLLEAGSSSPAGRADETDTAFGLSGVMVGAVGLAVEADQALGLTEYVEPPAPPEVEESRGGGGGRMPAAQSAQQKRWRQDRQEEDDIARVLAVLTAIGVFA